MKRIPNILLLVTITVCVGAYSFYRSHGRTFIWGAWQGDRAVFIVTIAVLVLILIAGFDMTRAPKWVSKPLKMISDSVLGAYLVSYIFDTVFYKKLLTAVPEVYNRYPYYFAIVPLVLTCSILTSMGLNIIWWLISTPVTKLYRLIRRTESAKEPAECVALDAKNASDNELPEKQPELTEVK